MTKNDFWFALLILSFLVMYITAIANGVIMSDMPTSVGG